MLEKLYKNLPKFFDKRSGTLLEIILKAISEVFENFKEDYLKIIANCSAITSSGFWLDFWGFLYGIRRFTKESDFTYRIRILTAITHGSLTRKAILEITKLHSKMPPILIEHNGTILNNYDYSDYQYDFNNFVMTLFYDPQFVSRLNKAFFIGNSYISYDTYLFRSEERYSTVQVKNIIDSLKMAGIKLIHNTKVR